MKELIKKLSDMRAISGYEYRANGEILEIIKEYADDAYIDNLGSVIAVKRCGEKNAKRVMLEAHCDEIGLMVSDIDDKGFLTVVNVGGVDPRILPSTEVIVHAKRDLKGVIGAKPPHLQVAGEDKKSPGIEDMAVDTGLSAEEVKELVSVGDSITFSQSSGELLSGQLSGKSLDDRASVAALITVLKNLEKIKLEVDVYVVIASQEEVGGFGAAASAYALEPDLAIAVDVCHGITPDNSKDAFEVGSGAIIACGPNIHPKIFECLTDTAKKYNVKFELEAEGGNTGTDAWTIQVVRSGIPTGLLSIPLKYMHTSVETMDIADAKAVCDLLTFFVQNLDGKTEEWLCL